MDEELRKLKRLAEDDEFARLRYFRALTRAGLSKLAVWLAEHATTSESIDVPTEVTGDNYEGPSYRPALPGDNVSIEWPARVKRVIWSGSESQEYTYDNEYWLVELDGRFAFISVERGGTCSFCGSTIYDVAFSQTLENVIRFGMTKRERKLMNCPLEDEEDG